MLKSSRTPCIQLRGVRHNNLKNFDLDLPLKKLIVITGLSGSGKSSLAFDTLFAEGQRRYIETFSPYARQFLDRMDKPQVDSISGIPPAIAIEQRNAVKTTRSTVGTMTEICDYMKMLWPQIATLHCRSCGKAVSKESPLAVWQRISSELGGQDVLITFSLPLSEKLPLADSLALISRQGYQRLLAGGRPVRLSEYAAAASDNPAEVTVIQDKVTIAPQNRHRFVEACEQAYHFGKCKLSVCPLSRDSELISGQLQFSDRFHCAHCNIEYRAPSPALFSYNHPIGACPTCKGFGRVISIDYNLAVPDRSRTLRQGVVKPWLTGLGAECQADLLRMCRQLEIPLDVPFEQLPEKWRTLILEGEPGYGSDEEHEWPRAWYGVKGYFRWLESKAYKMHVRVLLSRYRAYTPCPACGGSRFQPEAMLYRVRIPESLLGERAPRALALSDFYDLPIRDSKRVIEHLAGLHKRHRHDPLAMIVPEVESRLGFLNQVGLGYLTLSRPTRSLSGGETERVNLTSCLGTRLVNTLFVLDEPSVGLHPRDTGRLVKILQQLRDAGNTVVVVEHEASVMRAADHIVDLGPGHGATGGEVVFQGTFKEILRCKKSLTGSLLASEAKRQRRSHYPITAPISAALHEAPAGRISLSPGGNKAGVAASLRRGRTQEAKFPYKRERGNFSGGTLAIQNAHKHNLKDFACEIPLEQLVCITGLSGSGKTTLIKEILLPGLQEKLKEARDVRKASERADETDIESGSDANNGSGTHAILKGWEQLGRVVLVDQSILGKTPRSNPAVYIGAFDHVRDFFAASEAARRRGLNASAFSFNSAQGQCERCRGAGFEKIEMQFLSDIFIRCPDCDGKRYRDHILQIKASPEKVGPSARHAGGEAVGKARSIADLLDATVEEAVEFLRAFPDSNPAKRACQSMRWLLDVGLGYLKLGQPINTLSGGESQRLKLVRHLAGVDDTNSPEARDDRATGKAACAKPTLFLFDEPTTGLHFEDVQVLLRVLRGLVKEGHSVVVIEHNMDVIRASDWIIDLGPGAGDEGGRLVAAGTPDDVTKVAYSETGKALRGE